MNSAQPIVIDPEFQSLIPPLTPDERAGLEALLKAEGNCRDPLVVWKGKNILVDGHNRFDICTRLGLGYRVVEREFADREAVKRWIVRNQFGRRNLTPYQRAELALVLEPSIAAQAKANQRSGGAASDGDGRVVRLKSDKPLDTNREVAAVAGLSRDTISKAKVLAAKAPDDVKAKLRAGETTINREYKRISQSERKAEQVKAVQSAKLPDGKYHVIVADPPWSYGKRAGDPTNRATTPYPGMSVDEIKALPVAGAAHDDCILWLWTTNAFLAESLEVARAWGFTVKTMLTWAKDRMGCGDWLRGQTEHCLLAVKGSPVVTLAGQSTLLHGPVREHSRKPDEFYALVESLCPGSKCELFSRQAREGWASFGAEVDKFPAETSAAPDLADAEAKIESVWNHVKRPWSQWSLVELRKDVGDLCEMLSPDAA